MSELVREMTEDEKIRFELDQEVRRLAIENDSLKDLIIKLLLMAERNGKFD